MGSICSFFTLICKFFSSYSGFFPLPNTKHFIWFDWLDLVSFVFSSRSRVLEFCYLNLIVKNFYYLSLLLLLLLLLLWDSLQLSNLAGYSLSHLSSLLQLRDATPFWEYELFPTRPICECTHYYYKSDFQMTVEKPKPKQLLRPLTTGTNSTMNQSQFLAIICNLLKVQEKSCVRGVIGFGFTSHWLKNWRESF